MKMNNGFSPSLSFFVKLCLWATISVAGYILFSWLWTLSIFWSDIYVGENKWHTLFYYHLYRLPLWIALGFAFWAWWKQQPLWLVGAVFLSNPYFFYIYGSIWLLSSQLAESELIEQVTLLNEWVVLAFFCLSIITFFVHWTTRYFQTQAYSCWAKILCLIVIIISVMDILVGNLSITIYAPLLYYFGGSKMSFIEQISALAPIMMHSLLAILATWFILEKKYHYFFLHLIVAYYYIFHTNFLIGLEHSWGRTALLPLISQVSSFSSIVFYTTTSLVFIIWLFISRKIHKHE